MNDLVHSIVHNRLAALRLPSFAGRGLPERMRSTAFALLGVTAAAALSLVAIFAQLSFPLAEPAPLPDEPVTRLAGAQRVSPGTSGGSLDAASPVPAPARGTTSDASSADGGRGETTAAPHTIAPPETSVGVQAPEAVPAPGPGSNASPGASTGKGEGKTGSQLVTSPAAEPAATTAPPEASAGSGSAPAPAPVPVSSPPKAVTSSPTPPQPLAPGNSSSSAAAEHASDRGIEASASSAAAESPLAPEPTVEAGNGNGNGFAKGQGK